MPTIISHPAVPLAIGVSLGTLYISRRLLYAGILAPIIPDLDVLSFRLGISYSHELGHRGVTHSIVFALALGLLAYVFANKLNSSRRTAFLFVLLAAISHGLLDMLTNGGHGVALLWPFTDNRMFFNVQVIEASPLSLRRFFGPAGIHVLLSEFMWVWVPSSITALIIFYGRRRNAL
jgi:inner membrane protein